MKLVQEGDVRRIPTPVNNGIYEMTVKAFDRGLPNYVHPIIIRGVLMKPKNDKGKFFILRCRGLQVLVRFYMDTFPPDVHINSRVTIIGDLLSANLGSKILAVDCVVVPKHGEFVDELRALMKKHVLSINTYCQKPSNDLYFIEGKR